jgi:hypothetical protein
MTEKRQQLLGYNQAYFCGPTPPDEQLFQIEELCWIELEDEKFQVQGKMFCL